MKTITVKELIKILKTADGNRIVVMASDEEGNSYSPLSDISFGAYNEKDRQFGIDGLSPLLIKAGCTDEDIVKGKKAICLHPLY